MVVKCGELVPHFSTILLPTPHTSLPYYYQLPTLLYHIITNSHTSLPYYYQLPTLLYHIITNSQGPHELRYNVHVYVCKIPLCTGSFIQEADLNYLCSYIWIMIHTGYVHVYKLFDTLVVPIILYGREVWGVGNNMVVKCGELFTTILLSTPHTSLPYYYQLPTLLYHIITNSPHFSTILLPTPHTSLPYYYQLPTLLYHIITNSPHFSTILLSTPHTSLPYYYQLPTLIW
jgi:hypothetical protein